MVCKDHKELLSPGIAEHDGLLKSLQLMCEARFELCSAHRVVLHSGRSLNCDQAAGNCQSWTLLAQACWTASEMQLAAVPGLKRSSRDAISCKAQCPEPHHARHHLGWRFSCCGCIALKLPHDHFSKAAVHGSHIRQQAGRHCCDSTAICLDYTGTVIAGPSLR